MSPFRFEFDLCGGQLALDFSNTVSSRHTPAPVERIGTYEDLVAFAEQTAIVSAAQGKRLRRWARADEVAAERVRRGAIDLREALYAINACVARREPPNASDLAILNRFNHRLTLDPNLTWSWTAGSDAPDAFLGPIVRAEVELLTSKERERIRLCEADDCVWVFLDASKNRSRRWCDMKQCGNRVKARRFYERSQSEKP